MRYYELIETNQQSHVEFNILTEEIFTEGILSAVQDGYQTVKQFGSILKSATQAHRQLRSLDGKKTFTTETLQSEAIRLRKELILILADIPSNRAQKIKYCVKKCGGAAFDGTYTSRNYYTDFIVYTLIKPIVLAAKPADDATAALNVGMNLALDKLVDKLVGYLLVIVTGIPNIDDIKDIADMGVSMVKATSSLANKINSLKPTDLAERPSPEQT
jgi:hypothetical protein